MIQVIENQSTCYLEVLYSAKFIFSEISFEEVEKWLVMLSPLFDKIYQFVVAK